MTKKLFYKKKQKMARIYRSSGSYRKAIRANNRARSAYKKVKTLKYLLIGVAIAGFIAYKKGIINIKKSA